MRTLAPFEIDRQLPSHAEKLCFLFIFVRVLHLSVISLLRTCISHHCLTRILYTYQEAKGDKDGRNDQAEDSIVW